jgi:hypothetical protein
MTDIEGRFIFLVTGSVFIFQLLSYSGRGTLAGGLSQKFTSLGSNANAKEVDSRGINAEVVEAKKPPTRVTKLARNKAPPWDLPN